MTPTEQTAVQYIIEQHEKQGLSFINYWSEANEFGDVTGTYELDCKGSVIGIAVSDCLFDLNCLTCFPHLERLELRFLPLQENAFEIISNLRLKYITLRTIELKTASFLNTEELYFLDISENNISDASFVGNFPKLRTLDLSYNKIQLVEPLREAGFNIHFDEDDIEIHTPDNKKNVFLYENDIVDRYF